MWKNKPEEKKSHDKKGNPINLDEIFGSEFESQNNNDIKNQNNKHGAEVKDSRNKNNKTMKSPKEIDESDDSIEIDNAAMAKQKNNVQKSNSSRFNKKTMNSPKQMDQSHESFESDKVLMAKQNNSVQKSNSIGSNNKTMNSPKEIDESDDSIDFANAQMAKQKNSVQKSESAGLNNKTASSSKSIDYWDESIKIDKEINAKIIKNINNLFLISEYAMCFQECKKFLDINTNLFCILLKVDSCKDFQGLIGKLKQIKENPDAVGPSVVKFLFGLNRYISLSDEAILNNNDALINFIDRIKQLNKYILAVAKKNQESKIKIKQKPSESSSNEVAIKTKKFQYGGQIYAESPSIADNEANRSSGLKTDLSNKSKQKAVIDIEVEDIQEPIALVNHKIEIKEKDEKDYGSEKSKWVNEQFENKFDTRAEIESRIEITATPDSEINLSQPFSSEINPETELLDFIENDEIIEESKSPSITDDSLSDFPFGFYLNYFDAVRGPKTFYDLSIAPDASIIDEMLDTMNKNHGYYVLEVNNFIIYSFLFEISSDISRGKIDLLQYAVCVNSDLFDVKNGDFSHLIRKYFTKSSQFFQNNKEIYLGLWYGREDSKPDMDKQKIRTEYMKILRITSELEAKVLGILTSKKKTPKSLDMLEFEDFKKNYMKKLTEVLDLIEMISKSS